MFYVSIPTKVFDKIKAQAATAKTEIIGILLGRVRGYVLLVDDAVSGEQEAKAAMVSLSPQTIAMVTDKIIKGELDGKIIGWYHSHPDMGVFMSATDIRTQKNLQQFSPKVVAMVLDHVRNEAGFFTLDKSGNLVQLPESYVNIYDEKEPQMPEHFMIPPQEIQPVQILEEPKPAEDKMKELVRRQQLRLQMERKKQKRISLAVITAAVTVIVILSVTLIVTHKKPELAVIDFLLENPLLGQPIRDYDIVQGVANFSLYLSGFDANATRNIKLLYAQQTTGDWKTGVTTIVGPTNRSTTKYTHYIIYWDSVFVPNGRYNIKVSVTDSKNNTVSRGHNRPILVDQNIPITQFVYPPPTWFGGEFIGNVTLLADAKDFDNDNITVKFYYKFKTLAWKLIGNASYNKTSRLYEKVWDTLSVIDGQYRLKAEVIDAYGLAFSVETPYEVTIRNHQIR